MSARRRSHGGRRPGAGRPSRYAGDKIGLSVTLTPEALAELRALAESWTCSVSEAVETLIRRLRRPPAGARVTGQEE